MSYFSNADIKITREEGERTAAGFETTSTTEVLSCRADYQDGGRSLERQQQLHERGDALLFCEETVTAVRPGDAITVDHDDGRVTEGTVEEIVELHQSLLISL